MIYIKKKSEPNWLVDFKKKNPSLTYDSEEFSQYRAKLNDELIEEQKELCAYCCCKITKDSSHNEHIEPRNMKSGVKSKKTLDFNNLVASCNSSKGELTCGKAKGNEYEEDKFISPLNPNCESVFKYLPDGTITGDEYTINLLNLNANPLKEVRKAIYKQLTACSKEEIEEIFCNKGDNLYPFINVVRYYLKNKCE